MPRGWHRPLSGRVTARAAKPAAEWFLRAKRGTLRVGDCVYTAPGPSGGTAGVPEVRADSVQGLAGRGRGYPRVSSGSDTSGDMIPASGRFITGEQKLDRRSQSLQLVLRTVKHLYICMVLESGLGL